MRKDAAALEKELSIERQRNASLENEHKHLQARYDVLKEEYDKLQQYVADHAQPPRVEYEGEQFIEPGEEKDFYTGERKEIVLSVLNDTVASLKRGSRRRDVVESVLAANGNGDVQKKREKELKKRFLQMRNLLFLKDLKKMVQYLRDGTRIKTEMEHHISQVTRLILKKEWNSILSTHPQAAVAAVAVAAVERLL